MANRFVEMWRAAAFARLLRFGEGTVFVDSVARRQDAAGRYDLVSAYDVAGGVLAFVVGLHHSSDSFAGAGAYTSRSGVKLSARE